MGLRLDATTFATDGYVAVAPGERGAVDTAVSSRHAGVDLALERGVEGANRQFLAFSAFGESRENGTPLQMNDTRLWQVILGADRAAKSAVTARAYAGGQLYHQTFSTIAPDRASERLSRRQRVPARVAGAWGQWSRPMGRRQVLVAGADLRRVEATSEEVVFSPAAGPLVGSQGRQVDAGLYAEDLIDLGRLSATAALRLDRWAQSGERRSPGTATVDLPDRHEGALSPRLALRYRAAPWLGLTSSAYRSFRAPTLNELYAAAENLLDARFDVGRTPVRTLGPPRSLRAGVRVHLAARP